MVRKRTVEARRRNQIGGTSRKLSQPLSTAKVACCGPSRADYSKRRTSL